MAMGPEAKSFFAATFDFGLGRSGKASAWLVP